MVSSIVVSLLALIFLVIFIIYRRKLINGMLNEGSVSETDLLRKQLQQTADTAIAQLETKIAQLEELLAFADTRIIELETRIRAVDAALERNAGNLNNDYPSQTTNLKKVFQQNIAAAYNDLTKLETNNVSRAAVPEEEDKRQLILAMAEQGYNVTEIAKATGKGKGEILLLLQLNKR